MHDNPENLAMWEFLNADRFDVLDLLTAIVCTLVPQLVAVMVGWARGFDAIDRERSREG